MHISQDAGVEQAMADLTLGGCYPAPLKMTNDDNAHFLETEVIPTIGNIQFKHWNKNVGKPSQEYFKGKHAYSIGKPIHKVGAIIGTFKRVLNNSSTPELFYTAMDEKYAELRSLKYSHRLLSN